MENNIDEYLKQIANTPAVGSNEDDERLQKQLDGYEIVKGFCSKMYKGYQININQTLGGTIYVNMNSAKSKINNKEKYASINIGFENEESFIFFLEALSFAEKKFDIDRKNIINVLTSGKDTNEIIYENKILPNVSL